MLVKRTVLNRDGAVMNHSSVKVGNRTEALARILVEQRSFSLSGYDDAKHCYWAKADEEKHLHQWRIVE